MGVLILIIIIVVVVLVRRSKNSGNSYAEVENAILSNDLGGLDWDDLENLMQSKGISESQYQSIRMDAHKKRAENGAADSQYFYALLNEGSDKAESEKYYKLAADQGFIPAITRLL